VAGLRADVAIIGGGVGGCAAALAAADLGCSVILTEETCWEGGQLTSQAVPPDEHPVIERLGCSRSYRSFRDGVRAYYRQHVPLSAAALADPALNPGAGSVSRLCHDPRVALAVLRQLLAPHLLSGRLRILRRHRPAAALALGDRVRTVLCHDAAGREVELEAPLILDATEQGDLLPLCGAEYVTGSESLAQTGEPHAAREADPRNLQAFTACLAVEHRPGEDHRISRPADYGFWRDLHPDGWPGPLLSLTVPDPRTLHPVTHPVFADPPAFSLWRYRRIRASGTLAPGTPGGEVGILNWPQNDYFLGPICDVAPEEAALHRRRACALSLALLYWLQTDAARPDGGTGYPGLMPRADVVGGDADGLALAPYVRESRRIQAELTVREQDIATALRPGGPQTWPDAVGIGAYRIDLHPTCGGDPYLDIGAWPFQIPLGALLPVRLDNLLPAAKNIGVTHITQGCYRVHPVEWGIGEAAGTLAAFCLARGCVPRQVRRRAPLLEAFRDLLVSRGVELTWPELRPL